MVDVQEQIAKFHEFIETYYLNTLHSLILKGERSLVISFSDILKFDPDLSEYVMNEPEDALRTMEIAIQQFNIAENIQIRVRLKEMPSSFNVKIRDIRSEHINKLIVLEGLVRQASDVRPQVVSAKFECPSCANMITMLQIEQKFREPSRCTCGRRGHFRLVSKDLVDAQRLVLEEAPEALEGGEQPKRLSVFLREDLVEPKMEKRTTPGAKIRAIGVIKEVPVQTAGGTQLTRYDLVAEANNLEPIEETYVDIIISPEDEKQIMQLANDPKIYQRLISSIAPSIYGHEDIKGALVLQLMGGVRKEKGDGTVTKGDIHILLVGDPGAAKSSLLMYMSKAAPKARYVAGRSASSAGITATVVKDEFLRGWALEAGAIVLANGGFLLLDEMDKMTVEDTSALHEAMAQQTVTISKANIQATLRARTSVLAAANPKLGRFDPYQPIAAQINLPPALINRFDLIFPVRDLPNKEKDTLIASHVLETQQEADQTKPEIPIELLKKYVAYVRQKIHPKLTQGAIDEIREFYVTLRN
ncbi:MAG: minichromosome maintenance protein MCM, partial [Nanoarchaeota archaeon]